MGTEIELEIWDGDSGKDNRQELIGYCVESPIKVLSQVYQTHLIHHYRDLYRPVDHRFPNNAQGLNIRESKGPNGTSIRGTLSKLDLKRAIDSKLDESPRTRRTYEEALHAAIDWHLVFSDGRNYLVDREKKREEDKEVILKSLMEVAKVTLGIRRPTVDHLSKILAKS